MISAVGITHHCRVVMIALVGFIVIWYASDRFVIVIYMFISFIYLPTTLKATYRYLIINIYIAFI